MSPRSSWRLSFVDLSSQQQMRLSLKRHLSHSFRRHFCCPHLQPLHLLLLLRTLKLMHQEQMRRPMRLRLPPRAPMLRVASSLPS